MKKTRQLKRIIVLTIVLMILAIVGLIIFLANVDIKKGNVEETTANNATEENTTNNSYTELNPDDSVTGKEKEGTTYDIVENDVAGNFQIILSKNKLYLKVANSGNFTKKYPNSKLDLKEYNEINTNNYNIKDIKVGKLKDITFLAVCTNDGKLTLLNLEQAISANKLVLDGELIPLDYNESKMQNVVKNYGEYVEETIILHASNGANYDLSTFLEL